MRFVKPICLIVFFSLFLAGCATPNMQLSHTNTINEKFANLGSVQIKQFIDYRPQRERDVAHRRSKHLEFPLTLSGNSEPNTVKFLQQVMQQEAQRTGIFTVQEEHPKYTMTGIIYSMVAGTADKAEVNSLHDVEQDSQSQQRLYDFANVRILAVLKHNGKVIFRKSVRVDKVVPTQKAFAIQVQATLLDKATTQAARQIFGDMEYRLKH